MLPRNKVPYSLGEAFRPQVLSCSQVHCTLMQVTKPCPLCLHVACRPSLTCSRCIHGHEAAEQALKGRQEQTQAAMMLRWRAIGVCISGSILSRRILSNSIQCTTCASVLRGTLGRTHPHCSDAARHASSCGGWSCSRQTPGCTHAGPPATMVTPGRMRVEYGLQCGPRQCSEKRLHDVRLHDVALARCCACTMLRTTSRGYDIHLPQD